MPRNKHPEETIKKILDVSLQLFAEKGYEQTTVLDIVNNLGGLTRGAFYHHFKSKEEVLRAIYNRDDEENNPYYKAMKADVPNGKERLKLVLRLGLETTTQNAQHQALSSVVHQLLKSPRFMAEHLNDMKIDIGQFTILLEEGMADGSLKQGNAKLIAELFVILINFWTIPNFFPATPEEMVTKVEMIIQIITSMGYDFIDDELVQMFLNLTEILKAH